MENVLTGGTRASSASNARIRTGQIISGFVVVFLLVASALPKLTGHASAAEGWERFGYPTNLGFWIGVLEASCALLYAIPRVSVLGAVVLTGFLGGAVATHLRIGDPWFAFPIAIGALAWLGLYLREERLHAVLPLRK